MAKEPQEVKRLLDAIAAFEGIEDDAECTAAVSLALKGVPAMQARLRQLRQARVQALRAQNLTWQQIAVIIGDVTPERAQQIAKGHSGASRKKAKGAASE
jgi:hypothetical protein